MFPNKSIMAVSCNHELIAKTMLLACCSYEDTVFGLDWIGVLLMTDGHVNHCQMQGLSIVFSFVVVGIRCFFISHGVV